VVWSSVLVTEEYHTINDSQLSLSQEKAIPDGERSLNLPGALLIDPYVRSVAEKEGFKVSENALWLIILSMREYVKSLLRDTVATIESINKNKEFPSFGIQVENPVNNETDVKPDNETTMKRENATEMINPISISALDLATSLLISQVPRSKYRTALESCFLSSFIPVVVSSQSDFLSVRQQVSSAINMSPSSRDAEIKNQDQQQVEVKHDKESIDENLKKIHVPELISNAESAINLVQAPPIRLDVSTKGMGRGAKNLAALKARATANVSIMKPDIQELDLQVMTSHRADLTSSNSKDSAIVDSSPIQQVLNPSSQSLLPPPKDHYTIQNSRDVTNQKLDNEYQKWSPMPELENISNVPREDTSIVKPAFTASVVEESNVPVNRDVNTSKVAINHDKELSISSPFSQEQQNVTQDFHETEDRNASPQRPLVRGRGFGVKNLAVLMARNVSSSAIMSDGGSSAGDEENQDGNNNTNAEVKGSTDQKDLPVMTADMERSSNNINARDGQID
jgi:hypothetical protein